LVSPPGRISLTVLAVGWRPSPRSSVSLLPLIGYRIWIGLLSESEPDNSLFSRCPILAALRRTLQLWSPWTPSHIRRASAHLSVGPLCPSLLLPALPRTAEAWRAVRPYSRCCPSSQITSETPPLPSRCDRLQRLPCWTGWISRTSCSVVLNTVTHSLLPWALPSSTFSLLGRTGPYARVK